MQANTPKKWSSALRNLPIRRKFFLAFMCIIGLTTALIGTASTAILLSGMEQKTSEMASQLAYQVAVNMDYRAVEFEQQASQLAMGDAYQRLARSNTGARSASERVLDAAAMGSLLNRAALFNSGILRLTVFMENGATYMWHKGNPKLSTLPPQDPHAEPARALTAELEAARLNSQWRQGQGDTIQFVKKVVDTSTLNPLGYLVYELPTDYFHLQLPEGHSLLEPANMMVVNPKQNEILLASELFSDLPAGQLEMLMQAQNSTSLQYGGQRYWVVQNKTSSGGWQVVCLISMAAVDTEIRRLVLLVVFTCLLCVLFAGLFAWWFSAGTTENIRRLEESMRLVEGGQLDVAVEPQSYDEIGKLSLQFNHMVARINRLVDSVTEERLLRQAKEYEILQAQIDPHFLYNTLGSIRCMAQANHQAEIEKMIASLVEILRMALGSKGKNCRLSEELTCVEDYLFLQKIRYEGSFEVAYNIQEETEDLYIVGFILQPIVENALYHGLEHNGSQSLIQISSQLEGGSLVLRVQDNGIGMDEQTIRTVLSGGQPPRKGFHSIGVRNVEERIQYYFGKQYGLSIQSLPGEGTTVEIRLPAIKEVQP